jgi:hypothetical protein
VNLIVDGNVSLPEVEWPSSRRGIPAAILRGFPAGVNLVQGTRAEQGAMNE